tara:strand:- start:68119 stop:68763 length:645 start_codon:yes stop_codon:yes gene_type:complete
MNKKAFAILALAATSLSMTALASEDEVIHSYSYSLTDINEIYIEGGIGTMEVLHTDGNELRVELELEGTRRYFVFNKRSVEDIEIEDRVRGDRLSLRLNEDDLDHVKAHWRVEMPSVARTHIELGVGQITAEFVDTELEVEVGVGAGDITLARSYVGRVEASAGVGSAVLQGANDTVSKRAMVSEESYGFGNGQHRVELSVGVGEMKVRLDDET